MGHAGPHRPSALRRDAPSLAATGSREEAEGPGRGPAAPPPQRRRSLGRRSLPLPARARHRPTGLCGGRGPAGQRGAAPGFTPTAARSAPDPPPPLPGAASAGRGESCRRRRKAPLRAPGSSAPRARTNDKNAHTSGKNYAAPCAFLLSAAPAAAGPASTGQRARSGAGASLPCLCCACGGRSPGPSPEKTESAAGLPCCVCPISPPAPPRWIILCTLSGACDMFSCAPQGSWHLSTPGMEAHELLWKGINEKQQ